MQIDRPTDCALAFAIPLTKTEFLEAMRSEPGSEYVKIFSEQLSGLREEELWARYEDAVASPALLARQRVEAMGVLVRLYTALEDLRRILQERRVLTLLAHWHVPSSDGMASGIELADGVCSTPEFLALFSANSTGTLDLRMCHSILVGERIKRIAPKMRVIMSQRPVTPAVQLPVYTHTIQMLDTERYDFPAATAELRKSLLRRLR